MLNMLSWSKEPSQGHKKTRKDTVGWTDGTLGRSISALGTLRRRPNKIGTVGWTDGPYSSCIGWLEWTKAAKDSSTGWSDGLSGDTVGLSDAQFESRQRRAKTRALAPDEPTVGQRFIRWSRRCEQKGFGEESFSTGWTYGVSEQASDQLC
jgi:hypothetical protein